MPITHAFVNPKADGGDATITRPSDWNADHVDAAGTVFPVTPATSERFFRTDRGLEYFYDGTRWLTTTLYREALTSPTEITVTAGSGYLTVWSSLYDVWLEDWFASFYVSTTNTGSAFWSGAVRKWDAGTPTTVGSAISTAAQGPNVFVHTRSAIGALLGTGNEALSVLFTKTSTPGGLLYGVAVTYRLVG